MAVCSLTRSYSKLTRNNPRKQDALVPPKIVHLGLGAFARAHLGEYVRRLNDSIHDEPWLISGVSLRTSSIRDSLRPQQGAYTIVERDGPRNKRNDTFIISYSVSEVLFAGEEAEIIKRRLVDPNTSIISMTVTEKAYCRGRDGFLDLGNFDVQSDINTLVEHPTETMKTLPGWVAQAILFRAKSKLPVTIMSLDNLPRNGQSLKKIIITILQLVNQSTLEWIDAGNVSFPNSVVDRIVPATSEEDLHDVSTHLKIRDVWPVSTEPYISWILEQKFSSPQPNWTRAGVLLVSDIVPYEEAKLRLLNGSHSLIAYLGQLTDKETVADTLEDELFGKVVKRFMTEMQATLETPKTFDLIAYQSQIFDRFCNAALRHKTAQIASDGSEKIPQRWLEAIMVLRRQKRPVRFLAMAVALWIRYLQGLSETGTKLIISDPRKHQLLPMVTSSSKAKEVITSVISLLNPDLAKDEALISDVAYYHHDIVRDGCRPAITRLIS